MESERDMTGKYEIEVYNKRVHYHLTVKRIQNQIPEKIVNAVKVRY